MEAEELPAQPVADGRAHDGHGVEDAEEGGGGGGAAVLVNVGHTEGVEGGGARPVQELAGHEDKLVPVVLRAGLALRAAGRGGVAVAALVLPAAAEGLG